MGLCRNIGTAFLSQSPNFYCPEVSIKKASLWGCLLFSCGDTTRTCDLQVMSLASYQLLHSAMLFLNCECKGTVIFLNHQIFALLFAVLACKSCVFGCFQALTAYMYGVKDVFMLFLFSCMYRYIPAKKPKGHRPKARKPCKIPMADSG